MEQFKKYLLPAILATSLSVNSCGKQPETAFLETIPSKPPTAEAQTESKQEVKTGLFDINDHNIPDKVRTRINRMIPLKNKNGDVYCHANPSVTDSPYFTSAHCGDKIHEKIKKMGVVDAPIVADSISSFLEDSPKLIKTLRFQRVPNNQLIYFAIPKLRILTNDEDYVVKGIKVFVGHARYLNTSKGTFLITKERAPLYLANGDGSSGSIVTNSKGQTVGVLFGGLFKKDDDTKVTNSILSSYPYYKAANTGIPVDKSKNIIEFEQN